MGLNIIPFRVSDKMKESYLLAAITAECEKEDRIAGNGLNIPYFMRARSKVDAIIQRGELDKEYKNYKKRNVSRGRKVGANSPRL